MKDSKLGCVIFTDGAARVQLGDSEDIDIVAFSVSGYASRPEEVARELNSLGRISEETNPQEELAFMLGKN